MKPLGNEEYELIIEVAICKQFGWSLEYVRNLGHQDFEQVRNIISGINRGNEPSG